MSHFINIDVASERKTLPAFVSKSEQRSARRTAREIARAGHDDVMRRMRYLRERPLHTGGEHRALQTDTPTEPTLTAWVFVCPDGTKRIVETEAEWQARLKVERAYGIDARNTVTRYRGPGRH